MKLPMFLQTLVSMMSRRSAENLEMEEELRAHIAHRADDLERSGASRKDAERRARMEFGSYERFVEECYESRGGHFFESLRQDIRFGLRMLLRSPSFTVAAVLTLALGIGTNAVVFSMLNGFLLRPLNVPQAESLFTIEHGRESSPMHSYPDYLDVRDRNVTLDGVAAYSISRAGVTTGDHATTAWLYLASGNYFDVLGVHPYLGRFFHGSDEHGPNSVPYIVLSHAYWKTRFLGDPGVIGRTVLVNKHAFTVLGVAPPEFRGTELYFAPDFWAPMVDDKQVGGWSDLNARNARGIQLIGHLKPGITPSQAADDLNTVASYLKQTYPKEDDQMSFSLARPGLMGNMLGRPAKAFLAALTLLAGLILLAACANLGGLFAARTADRAKEVAMRLALGSTRKRILRQLLTEAVMVSLVGGIAGLAGGVALLRWLSAWQPVPNFPVHLPVNPDTKVYAVALLLSFASGFLFGLVAVRQVMQTNPYQVIKSGPAAVGARRVSTRDVLLVVQIAVCAVLVTASLVAVRGLVRSLDSRFGFEPQNAIVVDTDLDMAGYSGNDVQVMQRRILDSLEALPGVTAVGASDMLPLSRENPDNAPIFGENVTDLRTSNATTGAVMQSVSPGYFKAAGTATLSGRTFTWHDDKDAPRIAVVNEKFARSMFGSATDAVGRYFKRADGTLVQIVGIVEDGKYRTLTEEPQAAVFLPILQSPSSSTWLIVRSEQTPEQMAGIVESTLRRLDVGLPFTMNTWNKELDRALFASRVATVSLGVLGALGVMLAATGLFGMASYSVSKRLRELGIRIAMGARRRDVLGSAIGRAARLLALGSTMGLLLGMAAGSVLASIVYQANPHDPLVLAGTVITMLLLGILATWIPARRALRTDPLMLLREQ